MSRCEWFLLCRNEATHLVPHPTLGNVPCCERCRSRFDLPSTPITNEKENDR